MLSAGILAAMLGFGPLPVVCEGDRYNFDAGAMQRCLDREAERDLFNRRIMNIRCKALRLERQGGAHMTAQDHEDLRECVDKGFY